MLSRGFIQLEKRHVAIHKRIKSMLPRRDSEKKAHPMARHSEILQVVETRLSMMNMTYFKYIDSDMLCFIPGKILDEVKNVLNVVETDQTPPRPHQFLQELRDLSSMAMEHFDEHILPRMKEQLDRKSVLNYTAADGLLKKTPKWMYAHNSLTNELYNLKKQSKAHKHHISYMAQYTQKICAKLRKQNMRLKSQSHKLHQQERKIQEQNTKIQEQEATLADIKKHIEEWDQKYTDLTTELVRARDEILGATLVSTTAQKVSPPSISTQTTPLSNSSKFYKSNIKPRMANILSKGLLQLDLERKRKSNLLPEIPVKRYRHSPEKPESTVTSTSSDSKEKRKKIKLPDLLDLLPAESHGTDILNRTKDASANVMPSTSSSSSTNLKFSTSDIGNMISFSLENFLRRHPFMSQLTSRKRKMNEDIDL